MQIVIKIGGAVAEQRQLLNAFFTEFSALPEETLVVHGGGARVSALSRRLGIEPRFVDGIRMTGDAEIELVEMVLAGLVNGEVVRAARRAGCRAVGISGADGVLLRGQRIGESRTATVESVDGEVIRHLWTGGYLPILAPVGVDTEGETVNINADESARAIAQALARFGPTRLCYISDVPGVLDTGGTTIESIEVCRIEKLITDGTITGGMVAKIRSAGTAVTAGLESVRIGTWTRSGDLAALLDGIRGTRIIAEKERDR